MPYSRVTGVTTMVPESLIVPPTSYRGWNGLIHWDLRSVPARGKARSRWLFLSLIIFIWSSVLPMYSWLRLLIEIISFWGFVLGTEGGIQRICQSLHSCTSSLHFVCIENVSTSQGYLQDRGGKEFACGTSTSCQWIFAGDQSKAAHTSRGFPF